MAGLGAFPAPTAIAEDLEAMYGVKPLCELPVLRQCVYANYAPRRSGHAAVQAPVKKLSGPAQICSFFSNFN